MELFSIQKQSSGFTIWYNRIKRKDNSSYYSKSVSFGDYREVWKNNGIKSKISYRTNGAKKENPNDTCLDCTLTIGRVNFGYTNWSY